MNMKLDDMIPHKKWCTLKKEPIKTTGSEETLPEACIIFEK